MIAYFLFQILNQKLNKPNKLKQNIKEVNQALKTLKMFHHQVDPMEIRQNKCIPQVFKNQQYLKKVKHFKIKCPHPD